MRRVTTKKLRKWCDLTGQKDEYRRLKKDWNQLTPNQKQLVWETMAKHYMDVIEKEVKDVVD